MKLTVSDEESARRCGILVETTAKNFAKKRNHAEHKDKNDNINSIKARQVGVFFFKSRIKMKALSKIWLKDALRKFTGITCNSDSFFIITNITTWGGDSNNVKLVKQVSFV